MVIKARIASHWRNPMTDLFARLGELLNKIIASFREVTVFIGGKAVRTLQAVTEVVPQVVKSFGVTAWNMVATPLGALGVACTRKPAPQAEQEVHAASDAASDQAIRVTRQKVTNTLEAVRTVAGAHGGVEPVSPVDLKRAENLLDPALTAEIRKLPPLDAHKLSIKSSKTLHGYIQKFVNGPEASNVVKFPANRVSASRAGAYKPGSKLDAEAAAAAAPRLWARDQGGASALSAPQREAALMAYGRFVETGDAIRVDVRDFNGFVEHIQAKAAARNPQVPAADVGLSRAHKYA
jgi:hypothetical protein